MCLKCKEIINKYDEYFSFTEYKLEKIVRTDYAHKRCWNKFLEDMTEVGKAKGVIGHLTKYLTKVGIVPPEEIVII